MARGEGDSQWLSRWFGRAVPTVASGLLVAVASSGVMLALGSAPAGAVALPVAAVPAATLTSTSPISPTRSNVSAWSTSAPTGSSGTVTVTLLNPNGVPVPGKMVTLTAPGSHVVVTPQSDPTNGKGQASFTVFDTRAEAATFTAFDWTDGITLSRHPCTFFGPGSAAPETPVTIALPVIAAGLLGGTAFLARRRRAASKI